MANASGNSLHPADSHKLIDDQQELCLRRSARENRATQKGLEYTRDLCLQAATKAKRAWRKRINSIHSLLATRKDIATLTTECEELERKMTQVSEAHEALEVLIQDNQDRKLLYEDFENISRENNKTLRMVSERIKIFEQEVDSQNSVKSPSTKSSKISDRSSRKSSRTSSGNSSHSSLQKRVQLEGDIASLRAKLAVTKERQERESEHRAKMDEVRRMKMEIIREEERTKEELKVLEENFRIKEQLADKEAKMKASIKHEEIDPLPDESPMKPPVESCSKELLAKFLNDQSTSVSDVNLADSRQPPDITVPRASVRGPEERRKETTLPKLSPLNPFAPSFKPINTSANTPLANPFARNPASSHSSGVKEETPKYESNDTVRENPNEQVQTKLLEVAKLLAETQSQSRLPLPEPGLFSGDLLQYPLWLKTFETLIEGRALKSSERLHFLGKYVKGEAKELVDSFLLLDSEDAYDKAKEMLKKRYGDQFAVATTCRKKLESWPRIHPNDGAGLRKYSDFLVQCEKIMERIGSLRVLNDDQENRKLVSKLPRWASNRWSRLAYHWKEENKGFPPFSEFVKFVVKEADIACDPVLSSSLFSEEDSSKISSKESKIANPPRRRLQGANTFATSLSKEGKGTGERKRSPASIIKSCIICNGAHDLDVCLEFMNKTVSERKEFVSIKGLCFACLQHGHMSKDCKERKICRVCNRRHPTPFHGDLIKREEDNDKKPDLSKALTANSSASCFANRQGKSQTNSMIVPVWLSHRGNQSNERLVYALLDDQSDTTFVRDEALRSLGISGPETHLLLSTMHATDKLIKTMRIEDLVIQDFSRQVTLQLPKAFSREVIPARREQIPRPEYALQWPHLKKIADQIAPYRNDVEIGLLIGSDCPRAIMPREIIPGEDDSPYAMRSDLGWGIIGKISQSLDEEDEERCDRFDVTDSLDPPTLATRSKKICNFAVRTHVKEVINPYQVIKMFEMDFSERRGNKQAALSQDDILFLKKMEEGICQTEDGHYQMPLPLGENTPKLPDNKALALRRLLKLKSRMENDPRYRRDYTAFMQDLTEKGYAEKVREDQQPSEDGRRWYIRHHGVYHPKKPEKIRVVFDCSATYMGQSLNKHLLQGPDLTNSLVGVLCRFRQEAIAFMCDLEAMFHQFKVAEKDRDFLRFYWWENGDTTKKPVHLFGAASSPGCSNFGLKRAANDYESEFGSDAANFIRNDFYVDDGLKSVATIPEAVSLIQNTMNICAKGGMRLHKFISNSKEVIATIAPEDRAKGVKDLDLHSDVLPVERALGIHWCVESDTFQFRIIL